VHGYEGWLAWQVAIGARLLCRPASRPVVTNAGGIRRGMQPGELMRITDHVNLSGQNPLTGPNTDAFGPRFPDMSTAYSPKLGAILEQVAASIGVPVTKGVYASLSGPSYETPAEIRCRYAGADAAVA
jgi:purine-nucleoside phosphorylase